MKVLIVTHHYLHGVGGGVFASRAYINAIAEIADSVTLMYPYKMNYDAEDISAKIKKIPVEYNKPQIIKALDVIRGKSHRYYSVFDTVLSSDNYDLVVFDNSKASFKLIDRAHRYGAKVVTIHHNCELEYNRDNCIGVLRPFVMFWTRKYECEAIQKSDLSLTLTKQDKKLLADIYNNSITNNIEVIGVFEYKRRKDYINNVNKGYHGRDIKFIITGTLNSVQTENSLLPWLRTYYPILKDVIPNSNLLIAGKSPSTKIQEACKLLNIELVPSPQSMQPFLDEADVYICPTALGGGLKLRIMDGLKNGLPILTHSVSARGYDPFGELGFLFQYNDEITFRKAVVKIASSSFDKQAIMQTYKNIFSFDSGLDTMKDLLMKYEIV